MPTYNKNSVIELLNTNDMAVVKGLEALYARQTADEQASGTTSHDNGRGFSGWDANILSGFAVQIQDWRAEKAENGRTRYPFPLSVKQLELARKKLRRYAGQLADIANAKAGNPAEVPAVAVVAEPEPVVLSDEDQAKLLEVALATAISEQRWDDAVMFVTDRAALAVKINAERAALVAKMAAAEEAALVAQHAAEDAAAAAAELAAERAAIQAVEAEDEDEYDFGPAPVEVEDELVAVATDEDDDEDDYLSL